MKRALFTGAVLLGFGTSLVGAELTVKLYREGFGDGSAPATRQILERYIDGVGTGFSWANAKLASTHRQPLYCGPTKLALNASNYKDLLNRRIDYLGKAIKAPGKLDETPIELVLLDALTEAFPCTAER